MKTSYDIPASAQAAKDSYALDVAKNKKAAASYYGFIAQHGKNIPFLTPARLVVALGISLKTLERWRKDGKGPAFVRTATKRIRYPIVELDRWVRENLIQPDSPESPTTK